MIHDDNEEEDSAVDDGENGAGSDKTSNLSSGSTGSNSSNDGRDGDRDEEDEECKWYKGSGAHHEEVTSSSVLQNNYYNGTDASPVHPRLLIYMKRDFSEAIDKLTDFVSKAGQIRLLGDAAFASAETPEHYDEAKVLDLSCPILSYALLIR